MFGNLKSKIKNSRSGFTLIEVLIYSVILAIFIGAALSFIASILGSTDTLLERNEVLANQEFVESKIYWILGQASSVSSPAANASGTVLTAEGTNPAVYPASFNFYDNQITLALAGQPAVTLTNNRVKAGQFLVQRFSNIQTSSTVSVTFGLSDVTFPYIQSSTTIFYVFPPN